MAGWLAEGRAGFEVQRTPVESGSATLLRYVPANDPAALPGTPSVPSFTVLSLQEWSGSFPYPMVARELAAAGGAFYALDVRQDCVRHGQRTLATFDEHIHAALAAIRRDHGDRDLVLMGHAFGGLVAAVWAHRPPGAPRALILHSPWLAHRHPLHSRLSWTPASRRDRAHPAAPHAIMAGYTHVAAGLAITCPVLVMFPAHDHRASPRTQGSPIARLSPRLGPLVTLAAFAGAGDDVVLSTAAVRRRAFAELRRWVGAYVLSGGGTAGDARR